MENELQKKAGYLGSAASNFSLSALYGYAVIFPLQNIEFIFNVGLLTFLIEFLSIHSSMAFLNNTVSPLKDRLGLVAIYSIFLLVFAFIFNNWYVILIFFLSLLSKCFLGSSQESDHKSNLFIYTVCFLLLTLMVCVTSSFWSFLFPFSPEVMSHKPVGSSGIFVDTPQTLLIWGIGYYGILGLVNLIRLFPSIVPIRTTEQ